MTLQTMRRDRSRQGASLTHIYMVTWWHHSPFFNPVPKALRSLRCRPSQCPKLVREKEMRSQMWWNDITNHAPRPESSGHFTYTHKHAQVIFLTCFRPFIFISSSKLVSFFRKKRVVIIWKESKIEVEWNLINHI